MCRDDDSPAIDQTRVPCRRQPTRVLFSRHTRMHLHAHSEREREVGGGGGEGERESHLCAHSCVSEGVCWGGGEGVGREKERATYVRIRA